MNEKNRQPQAIRAEQVRLLCEHAPRTIPFHPVAASVLMLALWTRVPSAWLCGWWLAILVLSVFRYRHALGSLEDASHHRNTTQLYHHFAEYVGMTGALWGLGYLMFAKYLPVEYLSMIVVALAGIGSSGLIASYGIKVHFFSFIFPALGIPMLYGFYQGGSFHLWISLLLGVFMLALLIAFTRYSKAVVELIEVRLLVEDLEQSKKRLEEANSELAALSSTDGLTQIANRRRFDNELHREWARAKRTGGILSYLMVDIDYFKAYNDHYGHLSGDDCLKLVAQTIQGVMRRPGDFLGRYGGEEFAIISPDTPPAGARVLAEKIRAEIEALQVPHAGSGLVPWVTVSIGVATMQPDSANRADDLIGAADRALYMAKNSGRNQVVTLDAEIENAPAALKATSSLG